MIYKKLSLNLRIFVLSQSVCQTKLEKPARDKQQFNTKICKLRTKTFYNIGPGPNNVTEKKVVISPLKFRRRRSVVRVDVVVRRFVVLDRRRFGVVNRNLFVVERPHLQTICETFSVKGSFTCPISEANFALSQCFYRIKSFLYLRKCARLMRNRTHV